ncbi:cyclin-dependent kinase inhibitor far1 [Lunasporangiospora selenospora]|uniref:Fatty acyl-CoA reductase n=1 Tax=Lunasporangiospora selenospora TaxID=979761 RepID=A0A9P6FXB6_9FUNG|nr:cyclin-dependent kinase inhibitor far1 [Lunasporangiospora selenospora]
MSSNASAIDASGAIEFYTKNNVVFLTGATGFVGLTCLEKILWSLPQVKKVYVLIRVSNKSKDLRDRFESDIVQSRVFERLRAKHRTEQAFRDQVVSKIVPVRGDIEALGRHFATHGNVTTFHEGDKANTQDLCLGGQGWTSARDEIKVFIHCAATLDFRWSFERALWMNTYGALAILEIARTAQNVVSYVHVSTAFVNEAPTKEPIEERLYDLTMGNALSNGENADIKDPEWILKKLSTMSKEELLTFEQEVVLKRYPHTYTSAKSLAEQLITSRYQQLGFPVAIVRPTAVGPAIQEPAKGWVQGIQSMVSLGFSCGLGRIQEWLMDENIAADLVPVDWVCKCILAAASNPATATQPTVPVIYHAATGWRSRTATKLLGSYVLQYWKSVPAPKRRVSNDIRIDMYPTLPDFEKRFRQRYAKELEEERKEISHNHNTDANGAKPSSKLDKLMYASTALGPFWTQEWSFEITNSLQLDKNVPQELHAGLEKGVKWDDYLHWHNIGIHRYIIGEEDAIDENIKIDYKILSFNRTFDSSGTTPRMQPRL